MHICILNVQVIFEEKSWVFLGIPRHQGSSAHDQDWLHIRIGIGTDELERSLIERILQKGKIESMYLNIFL